MPQRRAQFFVHPYDRWYPLFQEYYASALRLYLEADGGCFTSLPMVRCAGLLARLRRVRWAHRLQPLYRHAGWLQGTADALGGALGGRLRAPGSAFHPCVGQYELTDRAGLRHRVCIDSCDYGQVPVPELAAWSDVYFKTNFWPSRTYPAHVQPLPNCSPLVLQRLPLLRAARTVPKEFDICFLVRVAGGSDGREGIEHNLRLAEAVARSGPRTRVLAYLSEGDVGDEAARLARAGIETSSRLLPEDTYWDLVARSRLVVLRLGMHDCVPWTMSGALAIGACPVLDRAPRTRWPEPLRAGEHFLDLGIELVPGSRVGRDADYAAVPERLAGWLRDEALAPAIAGRAAAYFDRALDPVRLGAHLFATLEARPAAG